MKIKMAAKLGKIQLCIYPETRMVVHGQLEPAVCLSDPSDVFL